LLPKRALTNVDIEKFGKKHLKYFRGVFMRDTLPSKKPRKNECGIINLDSIFGNGTHWVAYFRKNNQNHYFDSFGNLQPPLEVIKYLGDKISYNYNRFQNFNTYNCGHLCLEFLVKYMKK
jgi:hypothetical protein